MATAKTTNLYKFLRTEIKRRGFNEFYNIDTDQIITNDDLKLKFMGKIAVYDADIENLVNDRVFLGLKLSNPTTDRTFKQWFINSFLYNQIDFQTIDLFRNQLAAEFIGQQQYIEVLFENYKDFLTGGDEENTTGTTDSRSNSAFSALPQDTAQLNLDTNVMDYPDTNGISRGRASSTANKSGKKYDPDALDKMRLQMEKLRNYFARALFYKL